MLTTPKSIPSLSSDQNPVVCKIRSNTLKSEQRKVFDYAQANWYHYRTRLDYFLTTRPRILDERDIDRAVHFFTASVLQAAYASIPRRCVRARQIRLPTSLCALLKLRNFFRRRYQRTRLLLFYGCQSLLNRIIVTKMAEFQNAKWASFLRTLHSNNAPLWKLTRYFKKPMDTIPPFIHHGTQLYEAEEKANLLAEHFASIHSQTIPQEATHHSRAVDWKVGAFLKRQSHRDTVPPHQPHGRTTLY